jgi:hypothetical protein
MRLVAAAVGELVGLRVCGSAFLSGACIGVHTEPAGMPALP